MNRKSFSAPHGEAESGSERNRLLYFSALGCVFTLLSVLLLRKIYDYDIWYHLSIGRKILETFHIPRTEFLVYPLFNKPTDYFEWGFGLFFYSIYRWTGYLGMSILNALIGAGSLFSLYRAAERGHSVKPVSLAVLGFFSWFVSYRLVYRPEMMLFLMLAAEIYLLERYDGDGNWRWLLPLPLFSFLLSNFHPSSIFLLGVLVFYYVQFLRDAPYRGKDRARLVVSLTAVFAAIFLAALLNPYGYEQVLRPFAVLTSGKGYFGTVGEFLPTFQTGYKWHFELLFVLGCISLLFQPRRRLVDWLMFIFFGYLGFRYVRNLALFALAVYVPVSRFVAGLADRASFIRSKRGQGLLWVLLSGSLVSALAFFFPWNVWGAGPYIDVFPVKSARVIAKLKPAGQLFNFYHDGGYLGWELYGKYPVSIDGRHVGFDKSLVEHNEVFMGDPGWRRILSGYRVSSIVTPATLPFSGRLIPLVNVLADDDDWLLAEAEPGGLLFIKREALPEIPRHLVLDKSKVWQQVISEEKLTLLHYPDHAAGYYALGYAYLRLGKYDLAGEALRRDISLNPGDREAAQLLEILRSYSQ